MTEPRVDAWIRLLAEHFSSAFPRRLDRPRTIGREAEYPVVRADGVAAEVADLWAPLMALDPSLTAKREGDLIVGLVSDQVEFSAEVGRGTIELITGPEADLHGIRARHDAALDHLTEACRPLGYQVLGYGIQPVTPATPAFMTPKARYSVLLDVIGESWLWFTLTASDQVHLDLTRDELTPITDLGNLLAGVTVALTANSPIFGGATCGAVSAREKEMGAIHAGSDRHGMPRAADGDAEAMIRRYVRQAHLLSWDGAQKVRGDGAFSDWLAQRAPGSLAEPAQADVWEAFLLHEHYIWNSARPRTAHATVELRAACQQPLGDHMAATALGAALVEGAPAIAQVIADALGADPWPAMRRYHHDAVRSGLRADEPAPGLVRAILEAGRDALGARGHGEEAYLAPLFDRLERRSSPAHDALAAFEAGGSDALIAHAARR